MSKRKTGGLILVLFLLIFNLQLHAQRSLQDKESGWSAGLMAGFYSREIKAESQSISMSTPAGLLMLKGKNLGGTVDLTFFAGYGGSSLNGLIFEHLPVSLEYQAGGISGPLLGVKADWPLVSAGDYTFGLEADLFTFLGLKRKFKLEGFAEPGEAGLTPNWSQATGGLYLLYDGLQGMQPYFVAGVSFFWGTFRATENIADLSGTQSLNLKGSGIISLTAGANVKLTDNLMLVPQLTVYPAGRTTLTGGLGLLYNF